MSSRAFSQGPFVVRRTLLMAGLCLLAPSATVPAQTDPRQPLLILDVKSEKQKDPYFFRTSKDSFKTADGAAPSREGLDTLNASGSASFSQESLQKIKGKIPARKITVVDLRQEAHGYINGLSVMWWADRNTANKGKTFDQVIKDESERLDALKKAETITVQQIAANDQKKTIDKAMPVTFKAQSITTEQELCRANELGYARIPVPDRERPDDHEVDRFIRFVRGLPEGAWLHFHCKAGHGRTTTFLAMYDMMRNARKVSPNDIIKRQWLLGGVDLFADPPPDDWRYPGAVQRRKFLDRFYQYCRSNSDGFKQSWSEWLAK